MLATGNAVTSTFLMIALIASVVGMAASLAGAHHLRLWRTETLAAAAATALIAWLLTLLAMGIACKEIHTGGYRNKRLVSICCRGPFIFPSLGAALFYVNFADLMMLKHPCCYVVVTENFGSVDDHPGLPGAAVLAGHPRRQCNQ
jgi:hypothetical protein